jgi:vancomycin resistance protein YoaR
MMNWKSWGKKIGFLAVFFLILSAASIHTAFAAENEETTIAEGISIDGMNVGGMTKTAAQEMIEAYVADMENGILELSFNGARTRISFSELGFEWENTQVVSEAAECGHVGNLLERYQEITTLKTEGKEYEIAYHIDDSLLEAYLQEQAEEYQTVAVDATMKRSGKGFTVTQSSDGLTVDMEGTMSKILNAMETDWAGGTLSVEAEVEVLKPTYVTEELELVTDCLGDYSTPYNAANAARTTNLTNGTHFINGVILLPGESLSIYDYLYPCTEENGYRSAVAYADGGYVDSIGGGICQIATTLYNALLEAELKVLTRAPHSMTVSYVEPGFDAAESEGSKDLSFMNNTDYPVYVEAWASNGTLYCALWGVDTRPSNRTVTYYNNILSRQSPGEPEITEDPSLPAGTTVYDQDSYDAIVVELYKQVTVDGEVTETTLLHTDRYKASAAKIRVGTGGAAEQSEESAENTEG